MRIAIDIDSTLHHYWDRLSDAALRRFGIDLPYEEQLDWGITRLRPDQLLLCIQETHCPEAILSGRPYPDAVETVKRWRSEGHFIQITSHRDADSRGHAVPQRPARDGQEALERLARLLDAALSEIAHFVWNFKWRIGHSLPFRRGGRKSASTLSDPIAEFLLQCNIFGAAAILTLKTMRRYDAVAKNSRPR